MIRTSNLIRLTRPHENPTVNLNSLLKDKQNMVINSGNGETIPESVIDLSLRMLTYDPFIKHMISIFRALYITKREEFRVPLTNLTDCEKELLLGLVEDMMGIIGYYNYSEKSKTLFGGLILSPKAQWFISGGYMEIAFFVMTGKILEELSVKYGLTYNIYRNIQIAMKNGILKHEFDLVIDVCGELFAIEIKSGKNFRNVGKYMDLDRDFNITSDHFLLVDNYLTPGTASNAAFFCGYYVSCADKDSYKSNLTHMIENGLRNSDTEKMRKRPLNVI